MKKCDDSRAGFQLAKHQLKLHIGHKRYLETSQSSKNASGSVGRSHIHMFINDIIRSNHFSLPAQHLLCCLSIVGSIPLPRFFINKLDNVITAALTTEEDKRMQRLHGLVPQPLLQQLEQGGLIRKFPYPIVYHKDFNPQNVDPTIELTIVPKLICYAIERVR